MYFPEYKDLAERCRQRGHSLADLFGFQLSDQRCLGRLHLLGPHLINLLSVILIEVIAEYHVLGSVLGKPAIARIAHDRQYPGARVSAAKPTDVLEGAHRGFLHDVLGVRTAAGQPAGEAEGIDEVWHKHLCEAGLVACFVHIQANGSFSFDGFMARRRSFPSFSDGLRSNTRPYLQSRTSA